MLRETLTELALAGGGFIATNLENIVVLISVFCGRVHNSKAVFFGFLAGSMLILAISLATRVFTDFVPVRYIGLLGVVPILLGVRDLLRRHSTKQELPADSDSAAGSQHNRARQILATLSLYACRHPAIAAPLQRLGPHIAPWVMIVIGIYVLLNTSTDSLPA